jgi:hypothetical protein
MLIRKKPFWTPKTALLNALKSPIFAHIFSFFSGLQAKIRGKMCTPPPRYPVQLCEIGPFFDHRASSL